MDNSSFAEITMKQKRQRGGKLMLQHSVRWQKRLWQELKWKETRVSGGSFGMFPKVIHSCLFCQEQLKGEWKPRSGGEKCYSAFLRFPQIQLIRYTLTHTHTLITCSRQNACMHVWTEAETQCSTASSRSAGTSQNSTVPWQLDGCGSQQGLSFRII